MNGLSQGDRVSAPVRVSVCEAVSDRGDLHTGYNQERGDGHQGDVGETSER